MLKEHERLEKITSLMRRLAYDLHDSTLAKDDKQAVLMRLLEYALMHCFYEDKYEN